MAWLLRRLTPQPLKVDTEPRVLRPAPGNGLPKAYIAVTDPWYAPLAGIHERLRRQPDWGWREIAASHDALLTPPAALTDMLVAIASGR